VAAPQVLCSFKKNTQRYRVCLCISDLLRIVKTWAKTLRSYAFLSVRMVWI
jgi:hypothetical protein